MSESQYREMFRTGLAPFVEDVPPGPDWDDLTSGVTSVAVSRPTRRSPGWLVGLGVAVVVLALFGLAVVLSPSSPSSSTAPVGTGPESTVEFDGEAAASDVEAWWLLVISGDIESAAAMSHPDVIQFNYQGFADLIAGLGDDVTPTAEPKSDTGGGQPAVCYTLTGSEGQSSGEVIFAEHDGSWLIQDIRSPTGECSASTTTTTLVDGAAWATPGVGMTDAFFADGRLLATDGERLFVADGHGSFDESPRMVTAVSTDSGAILWQQDFGDSIQQGLFIQSVSADRLLVSVAEGQVWTLDTATGEILREFDLLAGYGASGAVATDDVYFLGADTSSEGNTDPPHAMSVNFDDGSLNWETVLTEGTDLQPISPAFDDDTLIFTSTLSHPGSAEGNMVHALDPADGSILWTANLGGDQQFKFFPSLVVGNNVVVSGPDGAVALALATGEQAWSAPNAQPLALGPDGRLYAYAPNGIVTLDPDTGEPEAFIDLDWSPRYAPIGLWINGDQVVVSDGIRLRVFSQASGELTFEWRADPGAIVDFPILAAPSLIAIPIGRQTQDPPADREVVGLELP